MSWCKASTLWREQDLSTVADLVFDASPRFYSIFSPDKEAVLHAIASQLTIPESELGDCWVWMQDGEVVGAFAAYPVSEMAERQKVSLMTMLETFAPEPELMEKLRAYRSSVAPIGDKGFYLARIAIVPDQRGGGTGSQLLHRFEEESSKDDLGSICSLHVDRENTEAIRFYEKKGYSPVSGAEKFPVTAFTKVCAESAV